MPESTTHSTLSALTGQYVQNLNAPSALILLLVVGLLGNLLALHVLHRTRNRTNKRHVFLLSCQFAQDSLTLISNLFLYVISLFRPDAFTDRWACKYRVVLLFLNLYTCCVIFVMAIERWMALTKPFFYHTYISFGLLKRIMIMFWFGSLVLVSMTFFGIGIYWDEELSTCIRNRNAKNILDVMFSYLIFSIGGFFCVSIVYTNLAVIEVLSKKDGFFEKCSTVKRRIYSNSVLASETTTREERAFGWLMIFLCIEFVSCWIPVVILIPLNRIIHNDKYMLPLNTAADLLLIIHCLLDPCLYVLQHSTLIKSKLLQLKNRKDTECGIMNGSKATLIPRKVTNSCSRPVHSNSCKIC